MEYKTILFARITSMEVKHHYFQTLNILSVEIENFEKTRINNQSMPELFEKAYNYTDSKQVKATGYYPYFLPANTEIGPRTIINGQKVIMLGSNNYMGLTGHPDIKKAAKDAIDKYGSGCTGSRFLNGTLDIHIELEKRLAEFTNKDGALAFSTGYQGNLGVISAIAGKGDYIISDSLNHASIVDACRLSRATTTTFGHNDMESLEEVLKSLPKDTGKLIVTDGVFSMEGDLAKIPEIVDLADTYSARIMIDDAHGLGYMGPKGDGTPAHFNKMDQVDLMVGTFSKSFASIGGFVSADEDIIEYLQHNARSLMFSASIPPASTATVLKALDIIESEDDRRKKLFHNTKLLKKGLDEAGFDTGDSVTPIIPIKVRDRMKTFVYWKELFKAGVYTNPVPSPAVPVGEELMRTSLMANHEDKDILEAVQIFAAVGKAMEII